MAMSFLRYFLLTTVVLASLRPGRLFAQENSGTAKFSATVSVDLKNRIGVISPYIYGQYLEHVQRDDECIYPSIWDDKSPFADEAGLRKDVMAAVRELQV